MAFMIGVVSIVHSELKVLLQHSDHCPVLSMNVTNAILKQMNWERRNGPGWYRGCATGRWGPRSGPARSPTAPRARPSPPPRCPCRCFAGGGRAAAAVAVAALPLSSAASLRHGDGEHQLLRMVTRRCRTPRCCCSLSHSKRWAWLSALCSTPLDRPCTYSSLQREKNTLDNAIGHVASRNFAAFSLSIFQVWK